MPITEYELSLIVAGAQNGQVAQAEDLATKLTSLIRAEFPDHHELFDVRARHDSLDVLLSFVGRSTAMPIAELRPIVGGAGLLLRSPPFVTPVRLSCSNEQLPNAATQIVEDFLVALRRGLQGTIPTPLFIADRQRRPGASVGYLVLFWVAFLLCGMMIWLGFDRQLWF